MTPTFELYNPPSLDDGIARSLEYLRIFEEKYPIFYEGESLDEFVETHLGIGLRTLMELTGSIYAYFFVHDEDLAYFLSNPLNLNLSKETFFQHVDVSDEELEAFFQISAKTIRELRREIVRDISSLTRDQYDFTLFRRFPIVLLTDDTFTCLDIGFLLERVSFGLFRTIHNCLPGEVDNPSIKDKKLARDLSSKWGDVVETYALNILRPLPCFRANIQFSTRKGRPEQIDGAFVVEKSAVIIEIKGRYLSAASKYSGTDSLIAELDRRFGREAHNDKGALYQQRASNIADLSCSDDIMNVNRIFPVLIVDESTLRLDLVQGMLRSWFDEVLNTHELRRDLEVMPLSIIHLDTLEAMEVFLQSDAFSFLDLIEFFASEVRKDDDLAQKDSHSLFFRFLSDYGIKWQANPRMQKLFKAYIDNFRWRSIEPVP